MWIPTTAVEVMEAAARADLEETHTFDAKLALPARNRDLAIDVCAMTVDGGSIVYGLGEDGNQRLTVVAALGLAGVPERISQIVETSILEVPTIRVTTLPLPDDVASGFVVVEVPLSPRAPHQVVAGGDLRFYGRGAKGNRILNEREISDIYERRARWAVDRDQHLEQIVTRRAFRADQDHAYVHLFALPIGFDDGFLRASIGQDEMALRNALVRAMSRVEWRGDGQPVIGELRGWALDGAEGITLGETADPRSAIRISFGHAGEMHFFSWAGDQRANGAVALWDGLLAGNVANALSAAGAFYRQARFVGAVDLGVAVTGLRGAIARSQRGEEINLARADEGYPHAEFRSTDRVSAASLADEPHVVADRLLRRLLDALVAQHYEPLVGLRP